MANDPARRGRADLESEIVRQTRDAFRIKDDWPQALIMSMGTVFLLAGLGLDIAKFSADLDQYKQKGRNADRENGSGAFSEYATAHPGWSLLALGTALTLVGYFIPMKRAK